VSDDGLEYTFKLRPGVKFHNGKEMTSADAKASIERFQRMSLRKTYLSNVAEVIAVDPLTVKLKLKSPQPLFLNNFSQPEVLVAILPAEDGDKDAGATSLIGTGPYKLAENAADSHVKLVRFDEYALDTRYPGRDGYGGRKEALFDSITFRIIPEPAAMVAAMQTGEIHMADIVPEYAVPELKGNPKLEIVNRMPTAMNSVAMNMAVPPMDKLEFRQAIFAALDFDEIMMAATEGNYRLNPFLLYPGYKLYPENAKAPFYNIKDPELARQKLKEAGYNGETLKILAASTFPWHTATALVMAEQLKAVGINVEIETMDWPAVVARRREKAGWSLNPGQFGTGPWLGDPVLSISTLGSPTSSNNAEDPALRALVREMELNPDEQARADAWFKAQQHIIDNLLMIKLGDTGQTQVLSRDLVGFAPFRTSRLWGVGFA
jgi:peptide/nickel transport system substrate-binding protein